MALGEALRAAIRACTGLADPAPLEQALAALAEPWTVAVVGRTGAGKSSLISWLSGSPRPVGLGGVTRALDPVPWARGVLVDTPGIDDPDAALLGLDPVLEAADAVIWVTDGLMPLTSSERDVVAAALPPGRPLWIVVSKADLLDPDELPSVVQRVRDLARGHAPREVLALDLRRPAGPPPDALGTLPDPGPRRRARVRAALDRVREALGPVPTDPDALPGLWRELVRRATREVDQAIDQGRVTERSAAVAALRERAAAVHAGVREALGSVAPPPLPLPEPPRDAVSARIGALAAGATGARKALRSEAARWLQEGELALREAWPGAEVLKAARQRRERLEQALDAVETLLAA